MAGSRDHPSHFSAQSQASLEKLKTLSLLKARKPRPLRVPSAGQEALGCVHDRMGWAWRQLADLSGTQLQRPEPFSDSAPFRKHFPPSDVVFR